MFAASVGSAVPAVAQMIGMPLPQAATRSPLLGGVPAGTPTEGVLTLTLKKVQQAQPRRIEIS